MTAPLGTWVPMNSTGGQTGDGWLGGALGTTVVTMGLCAGRGTIWQMTGSGGDPPTVDTAGGEATAGCCGDVEPGRALGRTVSKEGTGELQGVVATWSLTTTGAFCSHLALLGNTAAQGTVFLVTSALGWGSLWKEPSW